MQRLPTHTSKNARHLRREMTDAERALWQHLRGQQLQGLKFRRQHPVGSYILDFACLSLKLAIELDGGQHADAGLYDAARTQSLENAGWQVLRFWNNDVLSNWQGVLQVIDTHYQHRSMNADLPLGKSLNA